VGVGVGVCGCPRMIVQRVDYELECVDTRRWLEPIAHKHNLNLTRTQQNQEMRRTTSVHGRATWRQRHAWPGQQSIN
jgi:hypothetical protein